MSGFIDCHIHAYPPEVIRDPRAWGQAHGEPWFTHCVAPQDRPTLQAWADTDQLLRDMDRASIEKVVMLGWYWENQDTCELQNGWFRQWHAEHPDRIHAFATVNPNSGQRGLDDVRRSFDAGLCGLGELLPQAQDFSFRDENFAALMALAMEAGVPTNLHVTDPLILPSTSTLPTPLQDYLQLAIDFPDATFIFAHWGGGIPFFEHNPRVARRLKNVYYDTAASPLLYDKTVFRHVCDMIGVDRILFGSDYPLMLYPRESTEAGFSRMIEDIRTAGLTPEEFGALMGGNARRLLRLEA